MQLPKSRLETLRFTLGLKKRKKEKKKSRMPFILNAFLKMSAHCFPAGNCSIIKYTRIPTGFQSDNKKVHHSVFLLSMWFTSESNKKSHYTLLFHVRTLCHPRSKVNTIENYLDLRENEKKICFQHLMVSKHRKTWAEGKYRKTTGGNG